jgi:hypothetical protein
MKIVQMSPISIHTAYSVENHTYGYQILQLCYHHLVQNILTSSQMSGRKNVFISHIHEDDAGLADLKGILSRNGLDVRDYSINSANPNSAEAENYIKYQILAPRIQACSVLIVYITPETKNSSYVAWEIEYAKKCGKRIVGVWAHGDRGCEVPDALAAVGDAVVGWHGSSIVDAVNGANVFERPDGVSWSRRDIARAEC